MGRAFFSSLCITKEYKFVNLALAFFLMLLLLGPSLLNFQDSHKDSLPFRLTLPKCFVQENTGAPCRTCGLTRSLMALYRGDWPLSIGYHPHGYAIALVFLIEFLLRPIFVLVKREWVPWADIAQLIAVGVLTRMYLIS